jgi:hypothetical protein
MNNKLLILISLLIGLTTQSVCRAATIPAGAILNVRTVHSISSHERVGRTFEGKLDNDVAVNGKVVLRAGTAVSGVVEASKHQFSKADALTLNITAVSVHGQMIPVKTTGGYELHTRNETRHGVKVYVNDYVFAHGTRMAFRLAKPINP